MTEDEMLGWHHWLSGHDFEQAPGDSDGQGTWLATVNEAARSWIQLSDRKTEIGF